MKLCHVYMVIICLHSKCDYPLYHWKLTPNLQSSVISTYSMGHDKEHCSTHTGKIIQNVRFLTLHSLHLWSSSNFYFTSTCSMHFDRLAVFQICQKSWQWNPMYLCNLTFSTYIQDAPETPDSFWNLKTSLPVNMMLPHWQSSCTVLFGV